MYEKHGLMAKLSNPMVLAYLRRDNDKTYTELVENALRKKLGKPTKQYPAKTKGNAKIADCRNVVPVKISDQTLIDHIVAQKQLKGISHRYTIESAILKVIAEED
jgi:hypothetical protein